jgi:hypothetical protein
VQSELTGDVLELLHVGVLQPDPDEAVPVRAGRGQCVGQVLRRHLADTVVVDGAVDDHEVIVSAGGRTTLTNRFGAPT